MPITLNFPELARQTAADGANSADEGLALRRVASPNGRIAADGQTDPLEAALPAFLAAG